MQGTPSRDTIQIGYSQRDSEVSIEFQVLRLTALQSAMVGVSIDMLGEISFELK